MWHNNVWVCMVVGFKTRADFSLINASQERDPNFERANERKCRQ